MSASEDDFLRSLRATFRLEADEHLRTIADGLLELEKSAAPLTRRDVVERIFRAAHSLKGAARAVDITAIESRCEALEDLFSAWKREQLVPSREGFDAAHGALDAIHAVLATPTLERLPGPPAAARQPPASPAASDPPPAHEAAAAGRAVHGRAGTDDAVRVPVAKLDARLLEAEEMLAAKLAAEQRMRDFRDLALQFHSWGREWGVAEPRVRGLRRSLARAGDDTCAVSRVDLGRVIEFLEWNADRVKSLEQRAIALARDAEQDRQSIGKLVDDLLEGAKQLLLVPFGTLSTQLSRLVRDLCRDLGKEADLSIDGDGVEIDKRILEEMKDPLIHLLRNCLDHGIETPAERMRAGKPRQGRVRVAASRVNGSKVKLHVSDDGAGIDVERVKAAAIERGGVSADQGRDLSDVEARRLIFQTDVSTSASLTRLSGRGLGLAIVREKAEKLGGTVSVDSEPGRGTSFSIVVPSTLATFRGLVVEAAHRMFVVPTVHVERVLRVGAGDVRTVEGRETIAVGGRVLPLVRLTDVLGFGDAIASGPGLGFVLAVGEQRLAVAVDAIADEQEVLVKAFNRPLLRVRNVAGATVLASGQVAPVLHAGDLIKSARAQTGAPAARPAVLEPAGASAKTILVAEDSITSRMLMKSILESAGYIVRTAVDGMEAFSLLRSHRFDLVVSDVEMPRLDGFALTARIRSDGKLADVPVILVTALEAREDRERGIDVGANAYIVKSRFDHSNLLEAVQRLV